MCGGPYAFAKCTFFSGKKLPQKTVNGILTISTMCYIRHMCLFRSTLFPNKFTKYDFHCKHKQNMMSSRQNPPWRQLPSCAKDVRDIQNGCAHKTGPKTSFFHKDIDIAISWYWHQLYRYWHRQKCFLDDNTSNICCYFWLSKYCT